LNTDEIRSLMHRAHRSLRAARNLFGDGDHDFAVSRAYFAMFHAATAALLARDIKRSKHSGVIAAFGQYLVKNGPFRTTDQKTLQAAFRDRTEGDYAGSFPSADEVEHRIAEATGFVAAVVEFLRREGVEVENDREPSL
jgi:uncharacterized protein (UPF0332 family)